MRLCYPRGACLCVDAAPMIHSVRLDDGRTAAMIIRRFNVLCGCVLVPIMAAGQTAARACDPMAPPAQVLRVARTLYGQVRLPRGAAVPVQSYARQLLRAFADRFALPNPLKLGALGSGIYVRKDELSALQIDSGWIHPDLPLAAYLVINRNGTLRRAVVAQTTLVPGLDSALLAPLEAVVTRRYFRPLCSRARGTAWSCT